MENDLKIARKLVRMAKMLVASVYRTYSIPGRKCMIVTNYHYWPVVLAMKDPDGRHVSVVHVNSTDKEMFDKMTRNYSSFIGTGLGRMVDEEMDRWSNTVRNFRAVVLNILDDHFGESITVEEAESFFSDCTSDWLSTESAFSALKNGYDVSEASLERVFGKPDGAAGGTADAGPRIIEEGGFTMSIEHDDFTDEEARQLVRDVSAKLPESLRSGLCYGRAEIRKEFSKNYVGDYTPSEDYVRLAGDKSRFLSTFIHELGHRWMYKIASPRQIAAFKNAYDNARGRQLSLRPGDVIEFRDRAERYEFVQIGSSIEVIDLADRTMHFFTKKSARAIKSINGEKVVKYAFPSRYSQRNIREFIAVCFQFFCMGFSMDENLRSLVGRILENGQ